MAVPFHCPCGKKLAAEPGQVGTWVVCPGCGRLLAVPAAGGPLVETLPPVVPPPVVQPPAGPAARQESHRSRLAEELSRYHALYQVQVVPDAPRCVQCGICSYNCPMGIDVRAHAWRGQAIFDSSCLTCKECVRRCPRGVLRFESLPLFAAEG